MFTIIFITGLLILIALAVKDIQSAKTLRSKYTPTEKVGEPEDQFIKLVNQISARNN